MLISIVIPVYFNAPSLPLLAKRLDSLAQDNRPHEFEFIYVDDGSKDDSFAVLKQIAHTDPRVRIVKLTRNFGSNTAILAGISYARGDGVGFIAADLQDPPECMHVMIQRWLEGNKVVLAVRKDRTGDPFFTRLFAQGFNWLFSRLVFRGFSPQGVGFFFVDCQVAKMLLECKEKNAHLIGLILWSGYPFVAVEYDRVEREHGKSRWTFRKKFKYFIDAFTAFSYAPVRLTSFLGLLFSVLGGVYAVALVLLRLMNRIEVEGWTALMVVVLLASGVQLIMLGVNGEYLWRVFDAARSRPLFVVDHVLENSSESDPEKAESTGAKKLQV